MTASTPAPAADVGIPTFGEPTYLAEAIECVVAQTLPDWRLTISENGEGNEQERFERHHEMADRHQEDAEDDDALLPEPAVRKPPAQERREKDEAGVKAVDQGGERLYVERAGEGLERGFDGAIAPDILHMPGKQQIFRHVEDEQRAHSIVGEALPHLGSEQDREAERVAEEFARSERTPNLARGLRNRHAGAFARRSIQP